MSAVLQVCNRPIAAEEIIPLLASYQMLPRLLFELILDQAIVPFSCTPEEKDCAYQQFCEQNQLTTQTEVQAWLKLNCMTLEQLHTSVTRRLRIEKFKQAKWGNKLESYFFSHKSQLDKVLYSLIQTQDMVAQELYFRIQEGEDSFAELARQHSQCSEAQTGGLIGPVELSNCHPLLAQMLRVSQPGQLWPPTRLGEWLVIVRLEKFIPAQLDELMRQRLINELFADWLQEQVTQVVSIYPGHSTPSLIS